MHFSQIAFLCCGLSFEKTETLLRALKPLEGCEHQYQVDFEVLNSRKTLSLPLVLTVTTRAMGQKSIFFVSLASLKTSELSFAITDVKCLRNCT